MADELRLRVTFAKTPSFPEAVERNTRNTVYRRFEATLLSQPAILLEGAVNKMSPVDEPKGWRILQAMAQSENDPERLASIIDRMNRLLDAHERRPSSANSCTHDLDLN
jgi:hypothetical protein